MPSERPHPLPLREFLRRLRSFGIEEHPGTNHLILLLPRVPGTKQGPQFPIKRKGEVDVPIIAACLRRFDIDPDEFWRR